MGSDNNENQYFCLVSVLLYGNQRDFKLNNEPDNLNYVSQLYKKVMSPVYPGPGQSCRLLYYETCLLHRVPTMAPFMMRLKHPSKKCYHHNSQVLILLKSTLIKLGKRCMGLLIIPYHHQLLLKQN